MDIYYGIPSGSEGNFEEKEISQRLITSISALPCRTCDFTTEDPDPFKFVSGTQSLIHAFNLSKAGIQCQKLAEKYHLPLIVSCTGLDIYADFFNPALKPQLQELIAAATKIIVPFPAMASFIKARTYTSNNIEVIAPGILPLEYDSDISLKNFGLSTTDRLIVLSGGLLPAKNPIFAIHACEKLIKDYPNLKLVMFSKPFDSDYRRKVEEEASNRNWVNIIDKPANEVFPLICRMAEVFINVSHAEGYNPTLLNAMQCGCPILASDIHGNNAYINNEATFPGKGSGLLYFTSPGPSGYKRIHDIDDFVEKLKYLLENPDKRKEMANRAAIVAQKSFSIQKELYLHLQLYKSIL